MSRWIIVFQTFVVMFSTPLATTETVNGPRFQLFFNLSQVDLVVIEEEVEYPDSVVFLEDRKQNCAMPTINEFPVDLFSQEERQSGFILLHLFTSFYIFYAFAIVCGDYFIPSVERLSQHLEMESDIAGVTLMGIATSSPELFTNVVGTFIMKGDIGVGTIIGSAVFNHLAICACVGFATKEIVTLDWWSVTRDVVFYTFSVLALFLILLDERIYWFEAAGLLLIYFIYLFVMYKDEVVRDAVTKIFGVDQNKKSNYCLRKPTKRVFSISICEDKTNRGQEDMSSSRATILTLTGSLFSIEEKNESAVRPCNLPRGRSTLIWLDWICSWPARSILSLTIPDCRKLHLQNFYPLTFLMSTLWIALLSYLVSWMMTLVGRFSYIFSKELRT